SYIYPYFTANLILIGMRHTSGGHNARAFNQAVPIWRIVDNLVSRIQEFTNQVVEAPWMSQSARQIVATPPLATTNGQKNGRAATSLPSFAPWSDLIIGTNPKLP